MTKEAFDRHLGTLYACRACPDVLGTPITSAVRGARILLVGQAPGPHETEKGRPFAFTAGRRLFDWFEGLGVPEEVFRANVYIAAVARCFPGHLPGGGDRPPSKTETERCSVHLEAEVTLLRPQLVIAVGTAAAKLIVGTAKLSEVVGVMHRPMLWGHECDAIVLPHPSGRSTWLNQAGNKAKLGDSLRLIAEHVAFRSLPREAGR